MKHLVTVIDFDMPSRIKNHSTELGGFVASALGVITASQEQLEFWLRCTASLVAILAGAASLYAFIKNQRKNERAIIATALMSRLSDKNLSGDERRRIQILIDKALKNQTIRPEDLV